MDESRTFKEPEEELLEAVAGLARSDERLRKILKEWQAPPEEEPHPD